MLLPLSTDKVRSLSLENHLALSTIRAGRGNLDQLCCLLRVVYLAFYMREETVTGFDLVPYRRAEAVLDVCITRVGRDEPCYLLDEELPEVERVLALHDEQLAAVSRHRYLLAWERLQRFVTDQKRSPIPVDAAK
ncbi:hypothetical protein BWP39_09770 [Paraburkholderia acidicola]|uniref:Fis family transcriptional regulator n=1 Tax=Paraburkholderia acidicola TaxID=1912599 RepID=A0A2A4F394_9BURK|nr:hypothetical protein [Paraburkholderia acidicola]PCE27064.1 hypothetical protein BWP39_09770 [Paraburkholderia acidicola]